MQGQVSESPIQYKLREMSTKVEEEAVIKKMSINEHNEYLSKIESEMKAGKRRHAKKLL